MRSTIIKAVNMARTWGDLTRDASNPAADTEIDLVIEQKPATLDDAQLDQLLAAIAGHELKPLILVALGIGYRISECLGLLWTDIDEDHEGLCRHLSLWQSARPTMLAAVPTPAVTAMASIVIGKPPGFETAEKVYDLC